MTLSLPTGVLPDEGYSTLGLRLLLIFRIRRFWFLGEEIFGFAFFVTETSRDFVRLVLYNIFSKEFFGWGGLCRLILSKD
jgi:hypothetical protein